MTEETEQKILIVDDEKLNLKILKEDLTDAGYNVTCMEKGIDAWEFLQKNHDISVIFLDRMMPEMDGMELLEKIKGDESLKNIPVIMQTAAASTKEVMEGINAGVFYYLTKPFDENLMLAIVRSAINDSEQRKLLSFNITKNKHILSLTYLTCIRFRTLQEAKNIAHLVSHYFPDPSTAVIGITELLINAVEHGNLGIVYEEKSKLLMDGTFYDEIKKRSEDSSYMKKFASLRFERTKKAITLTIEDEGAGFDWEPFMEMSAARATMPNGRGIAIANSVSFDRLEYLHPGNKVICTVNL